MASDMVRVGAMWFKTSKKGDNYLSLSLDLAELFKSLGYEPPEDEALKKVNLSAFQVKEKKNEKSPDYSVLYFLDKK